MKDGHLRFALLVPREMSDVGNAPSGASEVSIERKEVAADDSDRAKLGFEPITVSAFVWVSFKIIGQAALKFAVGKLLADLYDHWKKSKEKPRFVPLRFPDGYVHQLDMAKPVDTADLERVLLEHAEG
jgi:hypothetical protein